jgi:hypothetical protein
VKARAWITGIVVLLLIAFLSIYANVKGGVEGGTAVLQLQDDTMAYGWSRFIINGGYQTIAYVFSGVILAITWIPFTVKKLFNQAKTDSEESA